MDARFILDRWGMGGAVLTIAERAVPGREAFSRLVVLTPGISTNYAFSE